SGKRAPVLAVVRVVSEREPAVVALILGVPQKTGGDPGFREHLVVHVRVELAPGGFLDDRAEEQVPGGAVLVRLPRNGSRADADVHGSEEIRDRGEAVTDLAVARIAEIVAGARGVVQ